VSNISQSGALLITEVVNGREDGWTRSAIRYATPVCEAVRGELSSSASASLPPAQASSLSLALESLPDPGMEGATLFADLTKAGVSAPDDQAQAADVEAWLAALGPIPYFGVLPTDGTKLVRWPETFGMPLNSIQAIADIKGLTADDDVSVLVGDWDRENVEDALTGDGYKRVDYGDATIFAVSGNVDDPSHPVNRAAGPDWYNVAVLDRRIFLSASSRRLREIVDIATGDQQAPAPLDGIYLRDRLIAGQPGLTAGEIVGRDFQQQMCVSLGVSGITPGWQGIAAFRNLSDAGKSGQLVMIPDSDQPLADLKAEFDQQIQDDTTNPDQGSEAEDSGYQGVQQGTLADGTAVLVAQFTSPSSEISDFFAISVEGCRFGRP
jgi:hypothetical protein